MFDEDDGLIVSRSYSMDNYYYLCSFAFEITSIQKLFLLCV